MKEDSTKRPAPSVDGLLFDNWFDAVEEGVRSRVRDFNETMLEEELSQTLARPRYGRPDAGGSATAGVRHGHRERNLTGTSGKTRITVPRARLTGDDGCTHEWRGASLRALAGKVVRGNGFGLVGDAAIGIVGVLIGDWLLHHLGVHFSSGAVGLVINATIGTIVLLLVLRVMGTSRWGGR